MCLFAFKFKATRMWLIAIGFMFLRFKDIAGFLFIN